MLIVRRLGVALLMIAVVAILAFAGNANGLGMSSAQAAAPVNNGQASGASSYAVGTDTNTQTQNGVIVGQSYKNDTSPPLRDMPSIPIKPVREHEVNKNPRIALQHKDQPDKVVQSVLAPLAMPAPLLNFDGIPFPGVACNCAPPDTDGEVGATQYVQMVNEGYQVFNKSTGASVLGPSSIQSIWAGFGGVCETGGSGDPVVLYDQLAGRWLISQFAGSNPVTDECIAISTTSDATGSYNRYGFHLGSNFFDYPHLGVWPDAYYMSDNVFNSAGTAFLGPQPFAFDRNRMLAGLSATFVSTGITGGPNEDSYLPADLDGSTLPAAGAPNSFVEFPGGTTPVYKTWHFHADFVTPANSTFTLFSSPPAASFTLLCGATRACVPQSGSPDNLDGIGDRLMFRLAYRNFGSHESLVGNYSVNSNGVAGPRWFELRGVTAGPETVFQESTYQPDTTWRWMGSIAQDRNGDMALGYSASDATISPQIRYSGRLVSDPLNQMAQGEAHLFDGTGSQTGTGNRWGDYSDMTVDPVDDCTFWYTSEYYPTTSQFNWRTRIGKFKFASCTAATPTPTVTGTPPTATKTPVPPTATATACGSAANYNVTTSTATVVPGTIDTGNHCDDCQSTVTLPFPFQLYDQTYNSVILESNGIAHFAAAVTNYTNTCMPVTGHTYTIYPYWDDLRTDATGDGIFTSVSGAAPNRIFNIEWRTHYFSPSTSIANFELRLYEGQKRFEVVYGTLTNGNTSATSGVQKDGSLYTQYFCNGSGGAPTGSVIYTLPACATSTPTKVPPTKTRTATRTATKVPGTATRTKTKVPATNTRTATRTATPLGGGCQPVTWTNLVNATASGNNLIKPAGATAHWDSGGDSVQQLSSGDGSVQARVDVTNTLKMFGFSHNETTASYTDIDYAWYIYSRTYTTGTVASAYIYEAGVNKGIYATLYPGNILKVAVEGGVVKYYRNSTLLHTSSTPPTYPLFMDASIFTPGAQIYQAIFCYAAPSSSADMSGSSGLSHPAVFKDVEAGSELGSAISQLGKKNAAIGYEDGTYRAYTEASRGQAVRMMVLALDLPIDTYIENMAAPSFRDVPLDDPYYNYIEAAYRAGIIGGYADGTFRPEASLTRGGAAKMVVLAAGLKPLSSTGKEKPSFTDVSASDALYGYIEAAHAAKLVSGYSDGTFRADVPVSRGQLASMVAGAMSIAGK